MHACALCNYAPFCKTQGRRCVALSHTLLVCFAQGREYAAGVARGIAEDNEGAGPVFIFGATGALCSVVNGYYEPTEEKGVDGRVMYRKVGDGGVWIEHFEGYWQILGFLVSFQTVRFAETPGLCSLEFCAERYWKEFDVDPNFSFRQTHSREQSSVKMVTGAEAVQQVVFFRMHARRPITNLFCELFGAPLRCTVSHAACLFCAGA